MEYHNLHIPFLIVVYHTEQWVLSICLVTVRPWGQLFNFLALQSSHLWNGHDRGTFHMVMLKRDWVKVLQCVLKWLWWSFLFMRALSYLSIHHIFCSMKRFLSWLYYGMAISFFSCADNCPPCKGPVLRVFKLYCFVLLTYSWLHPIFWSFLPSTLLSSWKAVESQSFSLYTKTYCHASSIMNRLKNIYTGTRYKFIPIDEYQFPRVLA